MSNETNLTKEQIFEIFKKEIPDNKDERNMKNAEKVLRLVDAIKKIGIDKDMARYFYDSPVSKGIVERILGVKLPKTQKGMMEYFCRFQIAEMELCPKQAEIDGYMCCLSAYFENPDNPRNARFFEVITKKKGDFDKVRELFKQKYPEVLKITDLMYDKAKYKFNPSKPLDYIKEFGRD